MRNAFVVAAMVATSLCGVRGAIAQTAPAGPQAGSPAATLASQYPIHDFLNDYAGVLDPDMRAQLLAAAKQIEAQHRVHLNIVIVRSLNGASVQSVSTAIANNWESRHTASQRSVQVLLDVDEHKMRFEICQNLEKVITDADADGMRQDMT
ncbi:MAG: TPM domain-containing protein, partial [Candidatus Acidiferrales bacterium]